MNYLKNITAIIILTLPFSGHADITPTFSVVKNISFGQTLFIPGNCYLDPANGTVTDLHPSIMCGATGSGRVGHYVIIANPNKIITITVFQRDNSGDGFIFLPEGVIENDIQSTPITVNAEQEINSGTSGVIDIFVGGQLFSTEQIAPSSVYSFERTGGIEWAELP